MNRLVLPLMFALAVAGCTPYDGPISTVYETAHPDPTPTWACLLDFPCHGPKPTWADLNPYGALYVAAGERVGSVPARGLNPDIPLVLHRFAGPAFRGAVTFVFVMRRNAHGVFFDEYRMAMEVDCASRQGHVLAAYLEAPEGSFADVTLDTQAALKGKGVGDADWKTIFEPRCLKGAQP